MGHRYEVPCGHTDFHRYSHAELIRMLYASDPHTVTASGDVWSAAGTALHERAVDLRQQLTAFQDKWTGAAADQYKTMISDLAAGIEQVATTALEIRDLTYAAAEALTTARARMPAVVPVPALSSTTVAEATTPLPAVPPAGESLASLAARQASARAAVTQQRQAATAAAAAYNQAVQVMTELANHYTSTKAAIPDAPDAAAPPKIGTDASGATVVVTSAGIVYRTDPVLGTVTIVPTGTATGPAGTLPVGGLVPGATPVAAPPPLFGRVFTAGLSAAASALGGNFSHALPGLLAHTGDPTAGVPTGAVPPGTGVPGAVPPGGAVPADAAGKVAGAVGHALGGGGGGVAGFGGTGGGTAATASPLLTGSATALGAGAGFAAGAASAGGGMSGMAPMMPMGGMMGGADGMGGARRIPPWLVETEDVWGESAAVTPSVIGDADPAQPSADYF